MLDSIQGTLLQSQSQIASSNAAQATKAVKNNDLTHQKAEVAAKDFEAVYISQMLTHMFAGIETDGMFGGGNAENIYRSMMVDEYGKILSQNGGIGLSTAVKDQIIALQSKHQVSLGDMQNAQ